MLRENQFFTWRPSKSNILGTIGAVVVFPLFFHYLYKDEQAIRDQKVLGLERGQRARL